MLSQLCAHQAGLVSRKRCASSLYSYAKRATWVLNSLKSVRRVHLCGMRDDELDPCRYLGAQVPHWWQMRLSL